MTLPLAHYVGQLRAAAEPTRARLLCLIAHGELSVGELVQVLNQSQPRLSRHLKYLTTAGLLERIPEGAWVFYRLPREPQARRLVDTLLSAIDPEDETLRRDRELLDEVRAARLAAADAYFARIASEWDALRSLHYSEADIERAVIEAAGPGPFDLALDFGTGTGRMLTLLAPLSRHAEGIDLSHHMLTVARAKLERAGVRNGAVRQGDASSAPYPDASADLVVIHQVLHFLDNPARAIAEAGRVLKPGGRLIVVDFAPHELEQLRTQHAHRRLGVSEADMAGWTERAGLNVSGLKRFNPPAASREGVAVNLWAADKPGGLQRPPWPAETKRSAARGTTSALRSETAL